MARWPDGAMPSVVRAVLGYRHASGRCARRLRRSPPPVAQAIPRAPRVTPRAIGCPPTPIPRLRRVTPPRSRAAATSRATGLSPAVRHRDREQLVRGLVVDLQGGVLDAEVLRQDRSRRRRMAWQSRSGATSTCAENAGKPEVTSQTSEVVHLGYVGSRGQSAADALGIDPLRARPRGRRAPRFGSARRPSGA